MATDCKKQPLLGPGLVDHGNKDKKTTKRRRYRRTRSAPPVDVPRQPTTSRGPPFPPRSILNNLNHSLRQVVLFLAIYLGVGTLCFYMIRGQIEGLKTNGFIDAIYFCVVTMTTLGYGDLVPGSILAKFLACVFVFAGMAVVVLVLSKAADYLVDKQEELLVRALHIHQNVGELQIIREIETKKVKYKVVMTASLLSFLVVVGTLVLSQVEGLSIVDSFYCVCCTITSLGYGDRSFSTVWGRAFAVFWILGSTICLARFFLYVAEFNTERRQQALAKWVLHRRMTYVDLEAADLDDDGTVGAADFVIYKLKEMGKIREEDVAAVLDEFEELDVDQSGTLSLRDLMLAQSESGISNLYI